MPCHAMPCHAMPCHAMPYPVMQSHIMSYHNIAPSPVPWCGQEGGAACARAPRRRGPERGTWREH
eukprot:4052844-Lingulodinium_polyedra.AAC.1